MSLGDLWNRFRRGMRSLRNGEFLLKVGADKFYMHIMYLFLLMWLSIMLSLKAMMANIHDSSAAAAEEYGLGYDLVAGANIAGFNKVATAMMEQGVF